MKQALEHIIALVERVSLHSTSLEVRNTLQLIAQTAHQALGEPTAHVLAPLHRNLNSSPAVADLNESTDRATSRSKFHNISVPVHGKEAVSKKLL